MNSFLQWCNSLHSTIKFEGKADQHSINFLDILVVRSSADTIFIKPYTKTTGRNSFLHYRSDHLLHLRSNLPCGQFLRIKCNATSIADYNTESNKLYNQFLSRGYPDQEIANAYHRAFKVPRQSLLQTNHNRKDSTGIACAFAYSRLSNGIKFSILRHWHIISSLPGLLCLQSLDIDGV